MHLVYCRTPLFLFWLCRASLFTHSLLMATCSAYPQSLQALMDADGNGTVSQSELLSSAKLVAEAHSHMHQGGGKTPQVRGRVGQGWASQTRSVWPGSVLSVQALAFPRERLPCYSHGGCRSCKVRLMMLTWSDIQTWECCLFCISGPAGCVGSSGSHQPVHLQQHGACAHCVV